MIQGKIYTVNENKEIVEEPIQIENGNYEDFLNKMIAKYNGRADVSLSKIKIIDFNKNMGTLYININSALQCFYDSNEKQQLVVDSIVKSLLSIDNKDFNDIQFYVQDQNCSNIFGEGYDTSIPLRK